MKIIRTNSVHKCCKKVKYKKTHSYVDGMVFPDKGSKASVGRLRWKIENQGFNRQKNWNGDITHACSWNINALKNHYLMQQISDFVRQLYERFYLSKNGIVKTFKKISSDLLYALTKQQLELEDICSAGAKAFC